MAEFRVKSSSPSLTGPILPSDHGTCGGRGRHRRLRSLRLLALSCELCCDCDEATTAFACCTVSLTVGVAVMPTCLILQTQHAADLLVLVWHNCVQCWTCVFVCFGDFLRWCAIFMDLWNRVWQFMSAFDSARQFVMRGSFCGSLRWCLWVEFIAFRAVFWDWHECPCSRTPSPLGRRYLQTSITYFAAIQICKKSFRSSLIKKYVLIFSWLILQGGFFRHSCFWKPKQVARCSLESQFGFGILVHSACLLLCV